GTACASGGGSGWVGGAVLDAAALADAVAAHRCQGRRIVFTNGCFDVVHAGHIAYLHAARRLGDVLVVAVNSDVGVRRLKGPDRPINGLADRLAVLTALAVVDHVAVFDDDTPARLLRALRPDVYVKGGDYTESMLAEAPLVRALGGEVRFVDYVADRSTSDLLGRIRRGAALP
ncbi:D-glycero-beta-D-manno-heptose 1-phosphate adenylyltransferase, partial [Frankia sp. AiPs1]|uniref:D-glycero-beta-D-manno-heptose 1-phosphate adenylyltransferase n=1 Tax=Frankia sp. AiPs1 TaxID=573493 RepID=UPI002043F11C